eukprot:scaffold86287_cov63-Phaeocystis_antarctica.AAC.3
MVAPRRRPHLHVCAGHVGHPAAPAHPAVRPGVQRGHAAQRLRHDRVRPAVGAHDRRVETPAGGVEAHRAAPLVTRRPPAGVCRVQVARVQAAPPETQGLPALQLPDLTVLGYPRLTGGLGQLCADPLLQRLHHTSKQPMRRIGCLLDAREVVQREEEGAIALNAAAAAAGAAPPAAAGAAPPAATAAAGAAGPARAAPAAVPRSPNSGRATN